MKNEDKSYENIAEIKLKKKVIEDFFNLPKIQEGKEYIIKITEQAIAKENNFPLKPIKYLILSFNYLIIFFFLFFREKKTKNQLVTLKEESLTKSICESKDTDSNLVEVQKFNISEPKKQKQSNGIFDCFEKCLDMCKKKEKKSSLLETY